VVITAIDSNVLLDFWSHDPEFGVPARDALRSCAVEGALLVCEVVWAETAGQFSSTSVYRQMLRELAIDFSPLTPEAAFDAAIAWQAYRARGGSRTRIAADFLIGAHALLQADRLLTRDHGFYRTYFKHLTILDPTRGRPSARH
jgi:predicted nucleic acid-binding protein